MSTLDLVDGQFVLACEPRMRDWASKVLGMSYEWRHPKFKDRYVGRATWTTYVSVTGVFGQLLEVTPAVAEWARHAEPWVRGLIAEKQRSGADFPDKLGPVGPYCLFSFQELDAWTLTQMGSAGVFSEMGTGKGPTVLGALRRFERDGFTGPTLIVCPNAMRFTWREEIERWMPNRSVVVVGGTAAQRKKQLDQDADFVVINYDLLPKHSRQRNYGSMSLTEEQKKPRELNGRFTFVILDEAHRIKDPKSQRTRCAWALGDEARIRYALTGTPIANNPLDLWALLRFLYPTEFTSRNDFTERYALMSMNIFGGMECFGLRPDKADEFYSIFEPKFIRRTKADVLPSLPPKVYSTRWVEMDAKQRKAYNEMAKSMITVVENEILAATDPLSQLIRLHQFAAATPIIQDGAVVGLSAPSCKVDALMELLEDSSEPVVVFMHSRKLLELVAETLRAADISFCEFKGGMSDAVREDGRRAFQDGERQVALCLFAAASEGLTLTRANRAIYMQRTYNMVQSKQSEDRIHRIGQLAKQVEVIDIVTADTAEAELHRAVLDKEHQLHQLVRDRDFMLRVLAA